jgi:hypothetical protein
LENPVAVQDEAEVQATLARSPPPCEGLGVASIRHLVPSHRSAKVPALELPTAVHAEGDTHDTLSSTPLPAEGLGLAWMRHRVPFHHSAKGTGAPELLMDRPTPMHAEDDAQDTLNSVLSFTPWGLGLDWMAHLVPSQRSARGSITPEPLLKSPTAVQEDEPEQETPKSWPVRAKRLRVGTIDHPVPKAVADGANNARALVHLPAGPPSVDAANAGTARTPTSKRAAANRDAENRLRPAARIRDNKTRSNIDHSDPVDGPQRIKPAAKTIPTDRLSAIPVEKHSAPCRDQPLLGCPNKRKPHGWTATCSRQLDNPVRFSHRHK